MVLLLPKIFVLKNTPISVQNSLKLINRLILGEKSRKLCVKQIKITCLVVKIIKIKKQAVTECIIACHDSCFQVFKS